MLLAPEDYPENKGQHRSNGVHFAQAVILQKALPSPAGISPIVLRQLWIQGTQQEWWVESRRFQPTTSNGEALSLLGT